MKSAGCGWVWRAALLGVLSVVACEQPSKDAAKPAADPGSVVLARVGDDVVTVEDLGWVPARVKPADRLDALVTRKLAAREARRRGLDEDPRTRAKLAQFRYSALTWEEGLLRNALYNSIRLGLTFNEEELRAHYEATKQRYVQPQWKLQVRRFPSEAEARAAAADPGATEAMTSAKSETLGPVPAEELPSELLPLLPLLKQPGDRQVLNRPGGWSLVVLDEYLPASPLAFELVREQVDQNLRAIRGDELLKAELAKLRAEQVVIDQAALENFEKEKAEITAAVRANRAASPPEAASPPDEAAPPAEAP